MDYLNSYYKYKWVKHPYYGQKFLDWTFRLPQHLQSDTESLKGWTKI